MNAAQNQKKFARGRMVASVGAFLVAIILIIQVILSGPTNSDMVLSFAGFTNYDRGPYVSAPERYQGPHAWFWFTNGARPSLWAITSVSRKMGEHWVEQPPTNMWIHQRIPETDMFAHLDSPHLVTLISFAVSDTNLPLRVIIESTERATGLKGIMDVLKQFDADHIHKGSYIIVNGRHYSVTNEFYER